MYDDAGYIIRHTLDAGIPYVLDGVQPSKQAICNVINSAFLTPIIKKAIVLNAAEVGGIFALTVFADFSLAQFPGEEILFHFLAATFV